MDWVESPKWKKKSWWAQCVANAWSFLWSKMPKGQLKWPPFQWRHKIFKNGRLVCQKKCTLIRWRRAWTDIRIKNVARVTILSLKTTAKIFNIHESFWGQNLFDSLTLSWLYFPPVPAWLERWSSHCVTLGGRYLALSPVHDVNWNDHFLLGFYLFCFFVSWTYPEILRMKLDVPKLPLYNSLNIVISLFCCFLYVFLCFNVIYHYLGTGEQCVKLPTCGWSC